jgi:threonine/homoserine/homoserine lactone efflux protein
LAAIAFSVSWVLKNATVLFEVLRWGGAAYLVWFGLRAWRGAGTASKAVAPGSRVNFARGVLVALSNPKTIAFFTAFLPQFIDPALPAGRQLAAMCIVSVLLAAATDSAWAVAAGLGRAWFLKPTRAKLLGRLSGGVLIGGGIWLSLARPSS